MKSCALGHARASGSGPANIHRPGPAAIRRGIATAALAAGLATGAVGARARAPVERAARSEPGWPYPLYGKALAKYGISEAQRADPLELGTQVGVGALDDAVAALIQAIRLDPGFEPALAALGRFADRLSRPDFRRRALDALRRADTTARGDPAVLLAMGRIEREAGSPDSADAAFRRYLAQGGLPGLGRLELARPLLAAGRAGGDTLYYDGARFDDSLTVAGFRHDIAVMLTDSQLTAFDATGGAARAAWLRRFWAERDQRELRDPGERLVEHYRRLSYAQRNFGLAFTRRHYPLGCLYRSGSMEFADRGVIYIRHGEPTTRLRVPLLEMMPNESWRYARPDGALIFHFGAGTAIDDSRLLASAMDIYGSCTVLPMSTPVTPSEVYQSRDSLDPIYGKRASRIGTLSSIELARQERRIGEASVFIGTRTDSYERRYARTMPVSVSLAAVGPVAGGSLVHIVYGIPGSAAAGTRRDGSWWYPVRLRFAATDSTGHVVAAADTAVILTTVEPVRPGSMLFGRFALPVPSGRWRYRLALEQGDSAGVMLPAESLVVPRFDGGLALSDPVLGWRPIALTWVRGADTVFFSPFHGYPGAEELERYYEVYGMEPGTSHETELRLSVRKPGSRRMPPPTIRVRFTGTAMAPMTSGRTLDLQQFKPGSYWLDLIVTDAPGHHAQRRIWFDVRAPRTDQ